MISYRREYLPNELAAVVREHRETGQPFVVVDSQLPKSEAGSVARTAWRAYRDKRPRRRVWGTGPTLMSGALGLALVWECIWRNLQRVARSKVTTATVAAAGAATVTTLVIGHHGDGPGVGALPRSPAPSAPPASAPPASSAPPSPGPSPRRQPVTGPTPTPGRPSKAPTNPHPAAPKATAPAVPPPHGHPSPRRSPTPAESPSSRCLATIRLISLADLRLVCEPHSFDPR